VEVERHQSPQSQRQLNSSERSPARISCGDYFIFESSIPTEPRLVPSLRIWLLFLPPEFNVMDKFLVSLIAADAVVLALAELNGAECGEYCASAEL